MSGRTRIKVCGIGDFDAAQAAIEAGVDAIGFSFTRQSPRFIEPAQAYEIMAVLPPFVSSVGVFTNPTLDEFSDIEEACPATYSQLSGTEPEKLVRQCGPGVIRAIRFDPETIASELNLWDAMDEVDALLIVASAIEAGDAFDWSVLPPFLDDVHKPVFLSGGLTPGNVGAAIRAVRPFAVDVSEGVESEPGVKDSEMIEAFCDAVREADGS